MLANYFNQNGIVYYLCVPKFRVMKKQLEANQGLPKSTLWLMTIGSGLVVANIYYNQPLLGEISRSFNVSESEASNIAMITQIGYALGLLFLIPLGDMLKRRPVILIDLAVLIVALLVFALSESLMLTMCVSLVIGFCSVVPQIFVPIASQLSLPHEKGKNVGIVMSGLLIGILASRVLSGIVGEYWGWREMYYVATVITFLLSVLIFILLPDMQPSFKGTYGQLMKSLLYYFSTSRPLRMASLRGGVAFGTFLAFWTTLTFHLEGDPFRAGSDVAGMLGLVGIGGALAASFTGRLLDRVGKHRMIGLGLLMMFASWLVFGLAGFTYAGLIFGIFLIDVGLQSVHITNQTIVFSLNPAATNRFNTVYMTSYFIGGASGTFIAGKAWEYYQWNGVVAVGLVCIGFLLLIHYVTKRD